MNEKREAKFRSVISCRQPDLTVILENVHDPHNIGAVLRSCDSIGIKDVYVLYNDPTLANKDQLYLGKRTTAGARKWVDVHFYDNTELCFADVRKKYQRIFCTHLTEDAVSVYDLDLTQPMALLFGNEHAGVTAEVLERADGNFLIPQVGMVESLNVSVACAVSLFEAFRQRKVKGFYDENRPMSEADQEALFQEYEKRHVLKFKQKKVPKRES